MLDTSWNQILFWKKAWTSVLSCTANHQTLFFKTYIFRSLYYFTDSWFVTSNPKAIFRRKSGFSLLLPILRRIGIRSVPAVPAQTVLPCTVQLGWKAKELLLYTLNLPITFSTLYIKALHHYHFHLNALSAARGTWLQRYTWLIHDYRYH